MQYVDICPPKNVPVILFTNIVTEEFADILEKRLSYESILEEAEYLNKIEEGISDDIKFQIELNTILEKGGSIEYYKELLNDNNKILEKASEQLDEDQIKQIYESYKIVTEKLKSSRVNEQDMTFASSKVKDEFGQNFNDVISDMFNKDKKVQTTEPQTNQQVSGEISKEVDNIAAEDLPSDDKSFLDHLKRIGSAITEGGSPIGILHLILDIIGVVGDFFGPVGLIADILNGLIYMLRGKYLLAIISFAAAVIPFAGPIFKNIFKVSKIGTESMKITNKMFGKTVTGVGIDASKGAMRMAAEAAPQTKEALKYVAKVNKGSLGKVGNLIEGFFKNFLAKITGWLPFIGKPLKKLFNHLGDQFATFSTKANKFSDDILIGLKKAELDTLNSFFEMARRPGSKIVTKGDSLVVISKKGMVLEKVPSHLLKSGDNIVERVGKTYGDNINKYMDAVYKSERNVAKFYDDLLTIARKNEGLYGKVNRWGTTSIIPRHAMVYFIGKQVVKYLQSLGLMGSGVTDMETEAHGSAAVHNSMQDITNDYLKNNPDAAYVVPYVDQFENKGAMQVLIDTHNDYAKAMGLPKIGMVGYYASQQSSKLPEEVREMYDKAYPELKGKKNPIEKEDLKKENIKESKSNLKYLRSYDDFI